MLFDRQVILDLIEPLLAEAGLQLYELEVPPQGAGILRVYLWRDRALRKDLLAEDRPVDSPAARGGAGVSLDDCAAFSKRLAQSLEEHGLYGEELELEVSSPGINRKLTRADHFAGAVGERVKVKFGGESARRLLPSVGAAAGECAADSEQGEESAQRVPNQVCIGTLTNFENEQFLIDDEKSKRTVQVAVADVRQAHVEFKF